MILEPSYGKNQMNLLANPMLGILEEKEREKGSGKTFEEITFKSPHIWGKILTDPRSSRNPKKEKKIQT